MMTSPEHSNEMIEYYDRRAAEYDRIYERDDPARQEELGSLRNDLLSCVEGKKVLELACGTGYWTEAMSHVAESIIALDASNAVLRVAQKREYGCRVEFVRGDLYALPVGSAEFDCVVAGFWVSHVPRAVLTSHLQELLQLVGAGGSVVLFDNVYHVESGELMQSEGASGDTYKVRELDDGSRHRVLKNYFDATQLRSLAEAAGFGAERIWIDLGEYYWTMRLER